MMQSLGRAALAAVCAGVLITSAASAQTILITKTQSVSLRDLDLSRDGDLEVLRQRIDKAVAFVCDVPVRAVVPTAKDECVGAALVGATAQMDKAVRQARRSYALRAD